MPGVFRLLRQRLAVFATLFAMVGFVGGGSAQYVHVLRVAHVTCAEHGGVLEIGGRQLAGSQATTPPVDQISTAPAGNHDHDCALTSLLRHRSAVTRQALPPLGAAFVAPTSGAWAPPVAAPLRWAPKTSPPVVG